MAPPLPLVPLPSPYLRPLPIPQNVPPPQPWRRDPTMLHESNRTAMMGATGTVPFGVSSSVERSDVPPQGGTMKRQWPSDVFKESARSAASPPTGSIRGDMTKTRKPSYLAKRHERDELADKVRALEEQLERLRYQAGLPTKEDKAAIAYAEGRNFDIEEKLHINDLYLARINSMVTRELLAPIVNPMSTFIRLPRDMAQRRKILRDIQDVKLRRAEEVAFERLHHLDHTMPYISEEKFTTANGEYHCYRMVINQFPNFKTARELYDVLVTFLYNMEISVTEILGQLAIREDTEDFDPTIWNHRIVTTAEDVGCVEELNIVGFARFYDESTGRPNAPYGMIAYDTVNVDDLYPYVPDQRTCKDVQTSNLVCEVRVPDSDETIVVLKQCLFTVQLPPQFPLKPEKLARLQENCSRWPVVLVKYLHDYVAPSAAAPTSGRPPDEPHS